MTLHLCYDLLNSRLERDSWPEDMGWDFTTIHSTWFGSFRENVLLRFLICFRVFLGPGEFAGVWGYMCHSFFET
jgi:hypothetical protein